MVLVKCELKNIKSKFNTMTDKIVHNTIYIHSILNNLNIPAKYTNVLQKDIENNEKEQDQLLNELRKMNALIENITRFSERPEWPNTFIQVNSLAYIPATLLHTNEYYVKLGVEHYSLMSLKETVKYLKRKIANTQETLDSFKILYKQLEERQKMYDNDMSLQTIDIVTMPAEITSNKGVAYKMPAGFYEIIESYIESEEEQFYKRRQNERLQRTKVKTNVGEDDTLFKRLDKLEEQETLRNELKEVEKVTSKLNQDDVDMYSRIKRILNKSDVYSKLLSDNTIQRCCSTMEEQQIEHFLNDLIIRTLKSNVSAKFESNELKLKKSLEANDDKQHNLSEKNKIVKAFLDSIESDV